MAPVGAHANAPESIAGKFTRRHRRLLRIAGKDCLAIFYDISGTFTCPSIKLKDASAWQSSEMDRDAQRVDCRWRGCTRRASIDGDFPDGGFTTAHANRVGRSLHGIFTYTAGCRYPTKGHDFGLYLQACICLIRAYTELRRCAENDEQQNRRHHSHRQVTVQFGCPAPAKEIYLLSLRQCAGFTVRRIERKLNPW